VLGNKKKLVKVKTDDQKERKKLRINKLFTKVDGAISLNSTTNIDSPKSLNIPKLDLKTCFKGAT